LDFEVGLLLLFERGDDDTWVKPFGTREMRCSGFPLLVRCRGAPVLVLAGATGNSLDVEAAIGVPGNVMSEKLSSGSDVMSTTSFTVSLARSVEGFTVDDVGFMTFPMRASEVFAQRGVSFFDPNADALVVRKTSQPVYVLLPPVRGRFAAGPSSHSFAVAPCRASYGDFEGRTALPSDPFGVPSSVFRDLWRNGGGASPAVLRMEEAALAGEVALVFSGVSLGFLSNSGLRSVSVVPTTSPTSTSTPLSRVTSSPSCSCAPSFQ